MGIVIASLLLSFLFSVAANQIYYSSAKKAQKKRDRRQCELAFNRMVNRFIRTSSDDLNNSLQILPLEMEDACDEFRVTLETINPKFDSKKAISDAINLAAERREEIEAKKKHNASITQSAE